ncbi:MAG: hypothetical protein CL581_02885 [Alteromonadaceae bacterium]|nr:hypothetical protein [Alteromonadaceae bacterium]MBH84392.1 hypothetical protein [Alteromonadaceae bacterium]|tara:strand:+ start:707 stop:1522 length:816 start_codon:yes stop_codon:yes gene_type:complete
MRLALLTLAVILAFSLSVSGCTEETPLSELKLTDTQLQQVGQKIFQNECAGKIVCLVHWNQGEAFPSLGIGHFIWYPKDVDGRFVESFPELIAFMRKRGTTLPKWLDEMEPLDAPWPDRSAFLEQEGSPRVVELRGFLEQTQGLQADFMFRRAQSSLERVISAAPEDQQDAIRQRIDALSTTPGGVYALMDYVNFKGEGLSPSETYNGQGWGLLQVLEQMSESDADTALGQFREAAATVLTRRASNAEKAIEREQWLPGWLNRLKTYHESN